MSPHKPLLAIVRPDRLGDVVVSSSVIKQLIDKYLSDFEIIWSVRQEYMGLFAGCEKMGVVAVEEMGRYLAARAGAIGKKVCGRVVFLNPLWELEDEAQALGYTVCGWGITLKDERKRCEKLETEYAAELLAAAGVPIKAPVGGWHPWVMPEKYPQSMEREYALIHIDAWGDKPTLAPKTIIELTEGLARKGLEVVWLGKRRECLEMSDVRYLEHLTIVELVNWVSGAKGVFGRDSGVAHLAAALGVPTVAVVGPLGRRLAAARWQVLGKHTVCVAPEVLPRWWESDKNYQRRYFENVNAGKIMEAWEKLK